MTEKSFLLTDDEMHDLTGTKMKRYQVRWLENQNPPFPFTCTITGKPRVLRAYVEKRLGLVGVDAITHTQTEPDWSTWEK